MAKLECRLQGDFSVIMKDLDAAIMKSASASREDSSHFKLPNGLYCAVCVYERYSMMGGNRVSLSITLVGDANESYLSAITAGGSQAVLFKINTFGEEAFLDTIREVTKRYER